jgi:hypothetical protein
MRWAAILFCAALLRCEKSCLNRETKAPKVSDDALGSAAVEHAADVFDEDDPDAGLHDDSPEG